jgi:hypothetical protein
MKRTISKRITVEIDLEAEAEVVCDPRYGADADGNRGVPMTFVEDVVIFNEDDILDQIREQVGNMSEWEEGE